MEFSYIEEDNLPKLSWCANIKKGNDKVTIISGPWVETNERFFCEGAWDGEFEKGGFEKGFLAGSGGKITGENSLVFATPSYSLERLFSVKHHDQFLISNSLVFLLSTINDDLDPHNLYYRAIFHTIRCGLKKCCKHLTTKNGNVINLHYYCNIKVTNDLVIEEIPKDSHEDFINYQHYTDYLNTTINAIFKNATDTKRVLPYNPVSTISTGYDSIAATVLAQKAGCQETLTFNDSNDSGKEISDFLGMSVTEYDRREYLNSGGYPEAEFVAGGVNSSFAIFLAFEKTIQQKLLVTGFNGEIVWDKICKPINSDMERDSPYADQRTGPYCLNEFRLRTGFFHLPVPYIGMTNQPSIQKISISSEMEPWSINNDYDRPIARRIAEESGIQRHLFGQAKKGAWLPDKQKKLTKLSYADFNDFCRNHFNTRQKMKAQVLNVFARVFSYTWLFRYRINTRLDNAGIRLHIPALDQKIFTKRFILRINQESLLPHWGIQRIKDRYNRSID